jgi:hypothetical protein
MAATGARHQNNPILPLFCFDSKGPGDPERLSTFVYPVPRCGKFVPAPAIS